jgi:hypothetical protein
MERLSCFDNPTLDELLALAASLDEGCLKLDVYEIHELLNCLIANARINLGCNTEISLRSASLERDFSGRVTVCLRRCGLSLRSAPDRDEHAA